jgi:hypothetical protein
MKISSLTTSLVPTAQSFAATVEAQWKWPSSCISDADATLIGTSFGLTISNYTEALAVQLFTEGFTDQSDSVNQLISSTPDVPLTPVHAIKFLLRPLSRSRRQSQHTSRRSIEPDHQRGC